MKYKLFLTGFVTSLLIISPASADDDSPLAMQMDEMNDAYKSMRRETDPAAGAAYARVAQDAMIKAIVELPTMVSDMEDGPEKNKAIASYRKMTAALIGTLSEMELAFLEEDMDKVKELVDAMRESKKAGHDRFMEDDE